MNKVSKTLSIAIKRSGLQQQELAKKIKCTPSYISKIEKGYVPHPKKLQALAIVLGLDPEKLIFDSVAPLGLKPKTDLSEDEQFVINKLRKLTPEGRKMLLDMIGGITNP